MVLAELVDPGAQIAEAVLAPQPPSTQPNETRPHNDDASRLPLGSCPGHLLYPAGLHGAPPGLGRLPFTRNESAGVALAYLG